MYVCMYDKRMAESVLLVSYIEKPLKLFDKLILYSIYTKVLTGEESKSCRHVRVWNTYEPAPYTARQ